MTRAPFEEVSAGQDWEPPHYAEWNAMLGAAQRSSSTGSSALQGDGREFTGGETILVNNSSGSGYDAGSVIAIGAPSFAPGTDQYESYTFEASAPNATDRGRWGIIPYEIPAGEFGLAISGGIAYCDVNVTHASHAYADVASGGGLESGFSGSAEIIHKPAGTGVLDCVVRFHVADDRSIKGVADADIEADSSALVSVWKNGADTGANVTAHLNWMHGGAKISSGKKLIAEWFKDEQKWVVTHAECESA